MDSLRPLPSHDLRDNQRPFRVLCYSHDSFGLGHLRRSVTLATAMVECGRNVQAICLTGSPVPGQFPLPERCDLVKLPSISKTASGQYAARRLPIGLGEISTLRSDLITATVRSFRPDLLLVDHTITGPGNELLPVLRRLRHEHLQTRVVLGMRDVLDSPLRARAELQRQNAFEVLESCYDHIFVYGERSVFDPVHEYGFPESIAAKTTFTSPVVPAAARQRRVRALDRQPHILVTTGGGEDGYELLRGTIAAFRGPLRGEPLRATVVAGPLLPMPAFDDLRRAVQDDVRIDLVHSTGAMQQLLDNADLVVGMGGYNTVYETLARGLPLLALPRRQPREEQWERCRRLAALGCLRILDDADLTDAHATAAAIRRELATRHAVTSPMNCSGAETAARLCLQQKRQRVPSPAAARFGC